MIYLGTSWFAAELLNRLPDDVKPSRVVTRPDRPAGRGRRLTAPPVKETAVQLGIPVDQPESVNDPDWVAQLPPDEDLVVCAFGALIKDPLLQREIFNVHPSLLPRWRGAAPIERAIMAGDAETGVSIMRIDAGMDSGPVALQERVPIGDDDFGTVSEKLLGLSAQLLPRALRERPAWVDQPTDGVTHADKITAGDRTLDLSRPAAENVQVVRALHPHIGARVQLADGSFLGVLRAHVGEDGTLAFDTVQPPGGTPMPYADYVRGRGEPDLA